MKFRTIKIAAAGALLQASGARGRFRGNGSGIAFEGIFGGCNNVSESRRSKDHEMMDASRKSRIVPALLFLSMAAGCRPTDPQPVATLNGQSIKSATCNNSIVTPTVTSCKQAILEKCRPGATIINVSEKSQYVYRHPGWATRYIRTVLLKDC